MAESSAFASHGDDAPIEPDEIQFDQAEYATTVSTGPTCGVCERAIVDDYYELGGKVFCSSCRQGVETALRGGSRLARVIKALVFGSAAAAVGAVIYYVILRATGYNISLVAVLVGFMVGGAVRKGTGNRGGLFYQILAVFLAYTAIGAMHLPFLHIEPDQPQPKDKHANSVPKEVGKTPAKAKVPPQAPSIAANAPARPSVDIPPSPLADAPAATAKDKAVPVKDAKNEEPAAEAKQPALTISVLLAVMVIVIYASPVIDAYQAPISGLIFGFALWEAWRTNKRVQLSFNGPFRVNTSDSNEPASEVDDGG